jgi:hypothetical protein
MYALAYVADRAPFPGIEIAWWKSYGVPYSYTTYQAAVAAMHRNPWFKDTLDGHVIAHRLALILSEQMVEVLSGRRQVMDGRMQVVNEAKAQHSRIMQLLVK